MSIKFDARYDQYAYRVSGPLNKAVTALNEGQFVTVNAAGEYILADGTAKAAWMTTSSMRAGRDQLKGQTHKMITVLKGKVCNIKTDQYDAAGDYSTSPVTKLKLDGSGKLTPSTVATDTIVAIALGAPKNGFLTIDII